MGATLEELKAERVLLLRSGKDHRIFGDPYRLSAVVLVNGAHGEIKGASGVLLDIPELKRLAREEGLHQISWERIIDGVVIAHKLDL